MDRSGLGSMGLGQVASILGIPDNRKCMGHTVCCSPTVFPFPPDCPSTLVVAAVPVVVDSFVVEFLVVVDSFVAVLVVVDSPVAAANYFDFDLDYYLKTTTISIGH